MTEGQRMTEAEYEAFVLSDPEGRWELHDGRLVRKPDPSPEHAEILARLAAQLRAQLDETEYDVRVSDARIRAPDDRSSPPE
jgi:Uma2 family endonuclease